MKTKQVLPYLLLVLSFAGMVDAAYLSRARYTHNPLACDFFDGCNIVASSPEALLFGLIPLAYLGLVFYMLLFALALALLCSSGAVVKGWFFAIATAGFASSLYFLYLQAFVIKAFCVYCFISLVIAAILFGLSWLMWRFDNPKILQEKE